MSWTSQRTKFSNVAMAQEMDNASNTQQVDGKGDKRKITRSRISYSCHECRKRKIKCDKVHPICSNCAKTGERCTYDPAAVNDAPTPEGDPTDVRQSLKRRRDPFTPGKASSVGSPGSVHADIAQDGILPTSVESRIDRLTALVEALRGGRSPPNGNDVSGFDLGLSPGKPSAGNGLLPVSPSEDSATLKLKYLSLEEWDKSRLGGSSFFASVAEELGELNQLLRNKYVSATSTFNSECRKHIDEEEDRQDEDVTENPIEHNLSPDTFYGNGAQESAIDRPDHKECPACRSIMSDKTVVFRNSIPKNFECSDIDPKIGSHLPSKRQSHILFRCWYSGVHGLIPVTYPPVVLEKYDVIWSWYESQGTTKLSASDLAYVPLFWAIWYAGSRSVPLKTLLKEFDVDRSTLSSVYHNQVVRWLAKLNFPRKASLAALSAYLIINGMPTEEEEPLTSTSYIGLAIRVAQALGFHRDPKLFGLPTWEAELRRRMWWHIHHTDVMLAIASGLPPIISDDNYCDVKPISELKDNYLRMPEGDIYTEEVESGRRKADHPDDPLNREHQSMVDVHYVVARAKYWFGVQISKVLKMQLGASTITRDDMQRSRFTVQEIEEVLNDLIRRIPTKGLPENGFVPEVKWGMGDFGIDNDSSLSIAPTLDNLAIFMGPSNGKEQLISSRYHWHTLVNFHKWSRIMLSMLSDRAHCLSYAPFLKQSGSRLWKYGRQCALHHSHGFLRKFISLVSNPAFEPFHWDWPGSHQLTHAAIILLVDLYDRPNSVEAPSSRAFIDKVYALGSPQSGIVTGPNAPSVSTPFRGGGSDAWYMLRDLRTQAWRKVGLDPNILWTTEEQQVSAGITSHMTEDQKLLQCFREDLISPSDTQSTPTSNPAASMRHTMLLFNDTMAQDQVQEGEIIKKRRYVSTNDRLTVPNGTHHPVQQNTQPKTKPIQPAGTKPPTTITTVQDTDISITHMPTFSETSPSDNSGHYNTSPSQSAGCTDASSMSYGSQEGMNDTFGEISMDTVFDWEAWDAVFGRQPNIDEEEVFYHDGGTTAK